MHVEMITPGSAGTYYMRDFLGKHYNPLRINPHRRDPKMAPSFKGRMAYLYSNPYDTVLSYHRRGFMARPFEHCRHIGGDFNGLKQRPSWILQDYLDNGIDYFRLENHFRTWFDFQKRTYDIMFIKYESLPKTINKLLEWYELDSSLAKNFNFKRRHSAWQSCPESIKNGLERIYGSFKRRLDGLDNIVILRGTT